MKIPEPKFSIGDVVEFNIEYLRIQSNILGIRIPENICGDCTFDSDDYQYWVNVILGGTTASSISCLWVDSPLLKLVRKAKYGD